MLAALGWEFSPASGDRPVGDALVVATLVPTVDGRMETGHRLRVTGHRAATRPLVPSRELLTLACLDPPLGSG